MFARLHALQTTQEQHDLGLEIVRDQLLPWLRDSSGFRGLIRLWSPAEAKTLVITLWADEESLQASAKAGTHLGELTAEAVGTAEAEAPKGTPDQAVAPRPSAAAVSPSFRLHAANRTILAAANTPLRRATDG